MSVSIYALNFPFLFVKDVEFGYIEGAKAFVPCMASVRRRNIPFQVSYQLRPDVVIIAHGRVDKVYDNFKSPHFIPLQKEMVRNMRPPFSDWGRILQVH